MKILRFIILNCLVILLPSISYAQSRAYLLEEADSYFKAGRYWDAFFRYRECAKLPEYEASSQIPEQIKTSSHALYLTQKFKDYYSLQKYEPAKENLVELISINANDPNRDQLPHITLAQGAELQRLAWRQRSPTATADMLKRAMAFYFQAAKEGLMEESMVAIKQCQASLKDVKEVGEESVQPSIESLHNASARDAEQTQEVANPRKPAIVIINPSQPKSSGSIPPKKDK